MSKSIKGYFLGRPHASVEAWINGQPVPPEPPHRMTTIVKYTAESGLPDWEGDIVGELTNRSIPNNIINAEVVEIGSHVTDIRAGTFYECRGLTSVTIPSSVTSIRAGTFYNCSRLTSLTIPSSVTSIGYSAFYGCDALTSVVIPNSVTSVGEGAFEYCSRLTTAEFKSRTLDQVKAIPDADGNQQYPWGLDESMIVPGVVDDVVLYTTAESPYTWRESAPDFDESTGTFSGFAGKGDAVKVIIPNKINNVDVTSIGESAFYGCRALTSVTIPNSVTSIGSSAFSGCRGLTSVTIGNNVEEIGLDAFYRCTVVNDVYCYPNPANLTWDDGDKDDFKSDGSTLCHVKAEYLTAYQTKFTGEVNVTFVGDLT